MLRLLLGAIRSLWQWTMFALVLLLIVPVMVLVALIAARLDTEEVRELRDEHVTGPSASGA